MRHLKLNEKRLFLQWAVMASLIAVGALFALHLGYGRHLDEEPTRITYVTLGVFALGSALCGSICWRLCGTYRPPIIRKGLKWAAFGAHLCVYLGLFGTAVGYYIMLQGGSAEGDPQAIIKAGFSNTSIAIVNTVVGCVTSILLQIQAHYAKAEFECLEDEAEERAAPPTAPPPAPAEPVQDGAP